MAAQLPENFDALVQKKVFAGLGTVMPDGSPQVTPVWIDFDGEFLLVNTAEGRQKDKNLQREPRVSLMLIDPDNPYHYVEVRGIVIERTKNGAEEHIDKMAKKYINQDVYPFRTPTEQRVLFKVKPERYTSMG